MKPLDAGVVLILALLLFAGVLYLGALDAAERHLESYNTCVSAPNVAGADCK